MRAGEGERVYAEDTVSERLRRWTRNPLGSARRGSNPLGVCRLQGWREATENSWRLVGGCDLWAWAKLLAEADD